MFSVFLWKCPVCNWHFKKRHCKLHWNFVIWRCVLCYLFVLKKSSFINKESHGILYITTLYMTEFLYELEPWSLCFQNAFFLPCGDSNVLGANKEAPTNKYFLLKTNSILKYIYIYCFTIFILNYLFVQFFCQKLCNLAISKSSLKTFTERKVQFFSDFMPVTCCKSFLLRLLYIFLWFLSTTTHLLLYLDFNIRSL